MSNVSKKMLMAAAGSAGGAGLDVDEVFSTFLYEGNGGTQSIVNNIDLSGEGGLVWTKSRETGYSHELIDTVRGIKKTLRSNGSDAEGTMSSSAGFSSFNSNGYSIAGQFGTWGSLNVNGEDHVSWTFRKAPKFFDVVGPWTGNASNRAISHNLGSVPGMIIVKSTSVATDWTVYHVGTDATSPENYHTVLNSTAARSNVERWNSTAPTSTEFTVGSSVRVNGTGETYVAYLFAHNNNDGGFGPSGDQDIIKCGSFTTDGSGNATVNLGFEPQFLIEKQYSGTRDWRMYDSMRGWTAQSGSDSSPTNKGYWLEPNTSDAGLNWTGASQLLSNGFKLSGQTANANYIYMAIRRGSLFPPDDATKVFAPIAYTTTDGSWQDRILQSNFTTDLAINGYRNISDGGTHTFVDRLRGYGTILRSHQNSAESDRSGDYHPWPQTGQSVTSNEWSKYNAGNGLDYYNYQWKRAPSYFDVTTWSGTGSARTVPHGLTVPPEMMWVKRRNAASDWKVYHSALGNTKHLNLNETIAAATDSSIWNDTTPTASVFTLGYDIKVNGNNDTYIAYLFATVEGVSKVGSYTGNGSTTGPVVDCGFSAGARFVLIKKSSGSGSFYVHDSARGIVAGNEGYLVLNSTSAEGGTGNDYIDPTSSGFQLATSSGGYNTSGETYIFYAIA